MALCKSPRQPSHALMITGGASGVVLPRRSCALLFFFPSNYPWGGFFLTLVLGKEKKNPPRNHFPIMNTHSSARPARRKTEKKRGRGEDVTCPSADPAPPWTPPDVFQLPFVRIRKAFGFIMHLGCALLSRAAPKGEKRTGSELIS